jgi:SAM-dependent methyltransferase
MDDPKIALNQAWWDERAPLHVSGDFYDIEAFKKPGANTLQSFEAEEVGDVHGLELVHLQCHFGLDSLSWARRGARVTGLDFSPNAIEAAAALTDAIEVDATFVSANVYDAVEALGGERFDIVYTGHGALCWLPDLERWADVVAQLLQPGGRLYLAEFHPIVDTLGEEEPVFEIDYFKGPEGFKWEGPGSYATSAPTQSDENWEWIHSLGEVVTSLAAAGLHVDQLIEREETFFPRFPFLVESPGKVYRMPEGRPRIPLSYSLIATKPA